MGIPVPFHGDGTLVPGLNRYEGEEVAPFVFLFADSGDFSATVVLDFGASGALAAAPGSLDITIQQIDVKLDPTPATVQAPSQLLNISTRLNVGTGNDVLNGGFIITGLHSKEFALRAIGPSLANSGVAGPWPIQFSNCMTRPARPSPRTTIGWIFRPIRMRRLSTRSCPPGPTPRS